jgi:3',5'-cyclic AMP phosphodiesterase CpdA
LHVSDLHLGRREAPEPFSALRELAATLAPELAVATGDLAHRGTRSQLERAAGALASLGIPFVAVPGNHDIPYTPSRFTRPFAAWESVFGSTEPVYASDRLVLQGLNSVRPWRQQGGALEASRLQALASEIGRAPAGPLRAVALHHHLAAPPWRAARKRPLRGRDAVLHALAEAGVELVLGGHVHQASVAERREFEVLESGAGRSLVLATAPGLGRPRPRRRGEAVGFNVYEWDEASLTVVTSAWGGGAFSVVGRRTFARS